MERQQKSKRAVGGHDYRLSKIQTQICFCIFKLRKQYVASRINAMYLQNIKHAQYKA